MRKQQNRQMHPSRRHRVSRMEHLLRRLGDPYRQLRESWDLMVLN